MLTENAFQIHKRVLSNGLTVLIKPYSNIPRVESHIWYNVGAKDEDLGEKGITHLIEHMLFKGTKNLSESDINLISHKLCGYSNAFTSHDSTAYTFRLPSNAWEESLAIFAECMQNATFTEETLASEIKAVIEEFGMYQEDYQNQLIESMIASMWPEHPYHTPVLGSKHDLCNMSSKKLLQFYKKHYHPQNATLVIVGNVDLEDAFKKVEQYFGQIQNPASYKKRQNFFLSDVTTKSIKLFRDIKIPWCCYAYQIPGFSSGQNYIFDALNIILANGNNSRLHRKIVDEMQLAVEVGSLIYEFNEKSLLLIFVYPQKAEFIPEIESAISEEIKKLQTKEILDWEFKTVKNKILIDYTNLLGDLEKQAFLIGNFYMTMKDENYLEKYMDRIKSLTKRDLLSAFRSYFNEYAKNCGYLLPASGNCTEAIHVLQEQNAELDQILIKKFDRKTPIEQGKWVNALKKHSPLDFKYPKPESFTLSNGLCVTYYNNPQIPSISLILGFKANAHYDNPKLGGIFVFLLRHMLDHTKKYTSTQLNRMLESDGIFISNISDVLTLTCLSQNLEKGLFYLKSILTNPSFDKSSIDKIKKQVINELTEFWETPVEFVEQVAKEHIYRNHPYSNNPIGSIKTVEKFSPDTLQECYNKYISPQEANLIIVGDLTNVNITDVVEKNLKSWTGGKIDELKYPKIKNCTPQKIFIPTQRDQLVIAMTAPSISRLDPNFNKMAILDLVLTGGACFSSNSRLFDLREKYGLFYAIGGSLLYNAKRDPGMMLIKTLVSHDKANIAKKLILECIDTLGKKGITVEEFENAKNMILSGNIEQFESNFKTAATFLFFKNFKLSANLFDKMGYLFSIIKIEDVNKLAKEYCNSRRFSIINVGRAN